MNDSAGLGAQTGKRSAAVTVILGLAAGGLFVLKPVIYAMRALGIAGLITTGAFTWIDAPNFPSKTMLAIGVGLCAAAFALDALGYCIGDMLERR
jgi:hypothetical protein